jgi:O-antigen ligase
MENAGGPVLPVDAASPAMPIELPSYAGQLRYLAMALVLVAVAVLSPLLALGAGVVTLFWLAAADPAGGAMRRFLVLSLGFPIYISAGGRDLATVSSALILAAVAVLAIRTSPHERSVPAGLLFLAAASLVPFLLPLFSLPQEALGPSIRRLVAMLVNIAAFWFVLASVRSRADLIDTAQSFHLMIVVTALVMIVTATVPGTGMMLRVFAHRGSDEAAVAVQDDIVRAMGTLGDYELAAELMALGMLLSIGLGVTYRSGGAWRGYAGTFVLMVVALGSTATRGALLAFGAGLLLLMVAGLRLRLVQMHRLVLPLAFTGILLLLFVAALGAEGLLAGLGRRLARTEFEGLVPDTRLYVWGFYLPRILESPWIGSGLALHSFEDVPYDPHSLWIHLLLAGGIPALVTFLILAGVLIVSPLRALLRATTVFRSDAVLLAITAAAAAFVVDQWKITYLRLENYQHMVWVLLGLCGAAARLREEESGTREETGRA